MVDIGQFDGRVVVMAGYCVEIEKLIARLVDETIDGNEEDIYALYHNQALQKAVLELLDQLNQHYIPE